MPLKSNDEFWRRFFTERVPEVHAERWILARLPSEPRCTWCNAPFAGFGGGILKRVFRRYPSNFNPTVCNVCDNFFRTHPGGAEVELSLMFADVRGSSRLAEQLGPTEFSRLMDRFYTAATHVVARTDGLVEKFVGDEVAVLYVPGFAGRDHARKALRAAREVLLDTGHGSPDGPWLSVGAGVHTGSAFIGSVGSGGVSQLTVLGDLPNVTARLASLAAGGEILASSAACAAAGLDGAALERRDVELRGRTSPLGVCVLGVGDPNADARAGRGRSFTPEGSA
jgi:adenylate cyclase